MATETLTVTGPAYWASAIINGDFSGLEDVEAAACRAWLEKEQADGWRIVSTADGAEPRFTWSFRFYGGECAGGDVLDYVAVRTGVAS
jgi:hypothetical protein